MVHLFLLRAFSFYMVLCAFFCHATEFGFISYTTYNIGDDIQAYAAKRLLPGEHIPVDREFIGVFERDTPLPTLVNGWYMHTKEYLWLRSDVPAPQKSWPPSPSIDPLLISIHLSKGFIPYAFSPEAVQYLKDNGPVGARDLNTMHELQMRGIPSYYSGCLTLTLDNECTERNDIIYAVDLDDACLKKLKSLTTSPIVRLTHIMNRKTAFDSKKREEFMHDLLEKYKRAKAVVTTRLHATMPCLALKTPVLLIKVYSDKRFSGLRDLVRNCSRTEFLKGKYDFNFDSPEPNPDEYLSLRENLLQIVNNWVSMYQ
ncbi:MAG: polysaccharide pyruvyl transferase family protein [Parachlamydiaceae bacterium]